MCGWARTRYLCDTFNGHSKTRIISHHKCPNCGSVFVGNHISQEELAAAYSTLDAKRYYDEIDSTNRRKMSAAIARLEGLVSQGKSVIDIGTGNGLFVEFLHDAGFIVSAHEIQGADLSKIEDIAHNIYQDSDYNTIPSAAFDAVTLIDVVEHVIDPGFLLSTCARILKPDGLIYFHTPVVTRLDRVMHGLQKVPLLRKVGTTWQRGRTNIFHLQNYTPKSLTFLLEKSGFCDIKIQVTNELSWPVARYIRGYLLPKRGLPEFVAPLLAPLFCPFLATNAFNANKAIVFARKAAS